ncbi:MAG TPA: threonine/serine exporter family protein [Streptosporangiaceae bacterium]|jgi:uncharacterized membrane protein YjjP (DUF1212 family)
MTAWRDRLFRQPPADRAGAAAPDVAPPPPRELIAFLRDVGRALCDSGDATNRISGILEELARRYHADTVGFFVLPTGIFVRIGAGDDATSDFAPASGEPLRLDQIGSLYALVDEALTDDMPPREGSRRLAAILARPPEHARALTVPGVMVLTLGLGLVRDPVPMALAAYAVLGLAVGALRLLAERFRALSLALPVTAALLVTVLALRFGRLLDAGPPAALVIPPLVTFLPGAALTIGTIELATGAIVAGATRLVYGFNVLFLLAFGILAGGQIAGTHAGPAAPHALGWWAPWLGVLLVGAGFYVTNSAPRRSLPWLLLVLYAVWCAQLAGAALGSALLGAFLGGLVITPVAYWVQARRGGPPAQVAFLPSFWLLVPGAAGLTGVSETVTLGLAGGIDDVVTTVVTVIAIALGVLVGSSVTRFTTPDAVVYERPVTGFPRH